MWRVKFGFLCGIIAAALFFIGDAWLGSEEALVAPNANPAAFAEVVGSSEFAFWGIRGMIGNSLEVVFDLSLWLYLSRTSLDVVAWWGAVFSIAGDFFGMLMFGIAYFIIPQLGSELADGNASVLTLVTPPTIVLIGMLVPTLIGLFLSVFAIWRSSLLPKWAAILWLVGMMLVPIQLLPVQLIASLLWLVAGVGFLLAVWGKSHIPE